jgi:hypothetical protein
MTFRDFAEKAFYLPATIFSGLTNLVLGHTATKKPTLKTDSSEDLSDFEQEEVLPKKKPGLLTLALDAVKYVATALADFIAAHKKAIAIAFWASLALAGAAALTLFLWPAALTAVAGVTVYGLSIAGIAGANALAQIGLAAALTFAATSAATYIAATFVNAFTAIRDFVRSRKAASTHEEPSLNDEQFDNDDGLTHSAQHLSLLGKGSKEELEVDHVHSSSPLQQRIGKKSSVEEVVDPSLTAKLQ